jgi:6-pyruvoyltetrahydropterin/6-carboxytetrahydropterin synthase
VKPKAFIRKETTFEAAHFLHNPKWSRAKNLAVFGKCSGYRQDDPEASGLPHGHSYRVAVTVEGPIHPDTGFVMDFRVLKGILLREVHDRFDHRLINREVEPFKGRPSFQPTAENLAVVIRGFLTPPLRKAGVKIVSVEVWENPASCATYKGK